MQFLVAQMCETGGGLRCTSAVLIHCHGNASLIVSDLYLHQERQFCHHVLKYNKCKNLGRNPCYPSLFVVGKGYRKIDKVSKWHLQKIYIFKEETEDNTCQSVKIIL